MSETERSILTHYPLPITHYPMKQLTLISRAALHGNRTAIISREGEFTYRQLLERSAKAAACLLEGKDELQEARVAFLVPSGFDYVATQWGVWRAGGIAVPLCVSHPPPELAYVIDDAQATIIVCHPKFASKLQPIAKTRGVRFISTKHLYDATETVLPQVDPQRRAMMIYTSGTTGKPKGVVITHNNIEAQVMSLISAWEWTSEDHILLMLPLHHIHGIINVLTCALWAGAICQMRHKFDAYEVWDRFIADNLTLFMAVPTIYVKLIATWKAASPNQRKVMSDACSKLRMMVSGSAALPVSVLEKWKKISGHILLERYGMTEIGMGLSNPLHGKRVPGHVGTPLPGVEARLVDEEGNVTSGDEPGEIQIKGPGVFLEYWQRVDATQNAFCDGWFCTGDMAVIENGNYRIFGRKSTDIIKTGGYKVSGLEIKEVLHTHSAIEECAVVGVKDSTWGECVAVALVLAPGTELTLEQLRTWGKERLAIYKVPSKMITVKELPRNAMGKVIKPEVVKLMSATD